MNIVIDSMQPSPASRALWWVSLACAITGGLGMRLATMDRHTPGLGAFVYFGLLAVMALLIALPCSVGGAFIWRESFRRPWLALLRKLDTDAHARWALIALISLATLVFASAGGRLPPWHVWASALCVNALIAWRLFPFVLREMRAAQEAQREVAHVQ